MIRSEIDRQSQTGQIILRPNFSLSWRGNLIFLFGLCCLSLFIGFGFVMAGAWVVLPYSILEISVLGTCLYLCVRQCYRQEVITLFQNEVTIEKGVFKIQQKWAYPRLWAKFMVKRDTLPWRPLKVTLRSHGEEIEIGSFLNELDKKKLIDELKQVVK